MTNDNEKIEARSPLDRTKEYRSYGTLGGGLFGVLIGVVAIGPKIDAAGNHLLYLLEVLISAATFGALVGYFAIQIFVGQLAAHGPIRQQVSSEENFQGFLNHEVPPDHAGQGDTGVDSGH